VFRIRVLLTLHNSLICTEIPEIINRQFTLEAFSRSPSIDQPMGGGSIVDSVQMFRGVDQEAKVIDEVSRPVKLDA
jgi:hypothetical protein